MFIKRSVFPFEKLLGVTIEYTMEMDEESMKRRFDKMIENLNKKPKTSKNHGKRK